MRTDNPLLTYNKWPLVIRRDLLEAFAELLEDETESALLISALVDGAPIPSEEFVVNIVIPNCEAKFTIFQIRDNFIPIYIFHFNSYAR